jgi:hypothetical protein
MFHFLAAAAAVGGVAAPLAAQSPYAYPYQQTYPQQTYPQQAYPQPYSGQPGYGYPQGYGYQQGYGQQGYGGTAIDQVVGQLLGTRYNVTDRTAVSRCASAAMVQAQNQYRGYDYSQRYGSPQANGYPQGIAAPAMRVTAITDVKRNDTGLRVKGLMNSGYGGYGGQHGYQNQAYANGDLTFRCNVDYRGAVTNVRIGRNTAWRG